jgi:colicin import membrane protein
MKYIAIILAAILLPLTSLAQAPGSYAAEKSRIGQERRAADATFKTEEKACYQKFAVTDCVNEARAKRRVKLSDLHRQEVAVNDAERKRKGAERQREIDERTAPAKEADKATEREKNLADRKKRDERATEKAAKAAAPPAKPGGEAARQAEVQEKLKDKASSQQSRNQEAAQNLKDRQAREAEAKARKEKLAKRLAERTKPASKPLPVPP